MGHLASMKCQRSPPSNPQGADGRETSGFRVTVSPAPPMGKAEEMAEIP